MASLGEVRTVEIAGASKSDAKIEAPQTKAGKMIPRSAPNADTLDDVRVET